MRKLGILIILMVCWASTASALEVGGGLAGFFARMDYLNTLIDLFETDNDLVLPEIHTGWGLKMDIPLFSFIESGWIGLGGRGLVARATTRDISIQDSLLGLYAWGNYRIGSWRLAVDVGGYRGGFSFPAARYVELVGWGGGITGSISYTAICVWGFSLGSTLSLQWLPIYEMHDGVGQRYRGRGTPFLDFSGVSVSIDLIWSSQEGVRK